MVRRIAQPCAAAEMAASPIALLSMIRTTSIHDPPPGTVSSRPTPIGSITKMNGTRNAGIVYFQACSVVAYGSPPVRAAAAKGESAVGGETSESTE